MVRYVRILGGCLKDFRRSHRFLSFADALRTHINAAVLRAASRVGLWICVIPGKHRWPLEACDTHVFASVQGLLNEEVQRRSGMTASREVSWEIVLKTI